MSNKKNIGWVGLAQGSRVLLQLAGLLLLSRLLAPTDFGLVAMAMVVVNFANLFRDMGITAAVIQRPALTATTQATAYGLSVLAGVLIALLVVLFSPLVAYFFKAPDLKWLLIAIAAAFPIASAGAVHQALLERDLRFAVVARIEMTSGIAALLLALWSAWLGAGAYAIAVQTVANATLSTLQFSRASSWRPALKGCSRSELAGIWKFSGGLIGFNLINYFSRNADSMIIGRTLGAGVLGAYSLAYRLMLFPVQNLTLVASRALYPVLSRRQSEPAAIAQIYLRTLSLIALVTAPLMAGVFVLRYPLAEVVFGPQWSTVPALLTWLAPVGFIQSLTSTTGTIFMALGRTRLLFWVGVIGAVLQVSAILVGSLWGIQGIVFCYFLANVVNVMPSLGVAVRLAGAGVKPVLLAVLPQCACALAMAWVVSALNTQLTLQMPVILNLMICMVSGVVVYIALVFLFQRQSYLDVMNALRH